MNSIMTIFVMMNKLTLLAIFLSLLNILIAQEEQAIDPDVEAFYTAIEYQRSLIKQREKIRLATINLVDSGKYDALSDYMLNYRSSARKDSALKAIGEALKEIGYHDAIPDLLKVYKYIATTTVMGGEAV